jgi:hypothetical protein
MKKATARPIKHGYPKKAGQYSANLGALTAGPHTFLPGGYTNRNLGFNAIQATVAVGVACGRGSNEPPFSASKIEE